ncbi:MAG: RodZ domain-containing protein [Smithella sp.]
MAQEKAAAKDFFGMREKRESLGMTLRDVFTLTRISVVNLEAIENGDFHALPVAIYAKNFIKIYTRLLGLDSKPILDSYEAYWKSPQERQPEAPVIQEQEQKQEPESEQKIVSEHVPENKEQIKEEEPVLKKTTSYKKVYIALAFVIAIIAVVASIIFYEQQPLPKVTVSQPLVTQPAPAPPTAPVTPPPAESTANLPAQPMPVSQPGAALPPAPMEANKQVLPQPLAVQQKSITPVKPVTVQNVPAAIEKKESVSSEGTDSLVIKATETAWLKIKIDQNPPFQILLKPGETIKRKGGGFVIDIGNAGGVVIYFKGKPIENLGKSGEVRHLQLP